MGEGVPDQGEKERRESIFLVVRHSSMPYNYGRRRNMSWEDEFRGFFWGEGYLGICRNGKRNGRTMYVARAQITLRIDDVGVLIDIKDRLGGNIHYERRGRKSHGNGKEWDTKPYACWRVRSRKDVSRVCDILEGGYMPSKKRREIDVVRRFLSFNIRPGRKSDDESKRISVEREKMVEEIQSLHRWGLDEMS